MRCASTHSHTLVVLRLHVINAHSLQLDIESGNSQSMGVFLPADEEFEYAPQPKTLPSLPTTLAVSSTRLKTHDTTTTTTTTRVTSTTKKTLDKPTKPSAPAAASTTEPRRPAKSSLISQRAGELIGVSKAKGTLTYLTAALFFKRLPYVSELYSLNLNIFSLRGCEIEG